MDRDAVASALMGSDLTKYLQPWQSRPEYRPPANPYRQPWEYPAWAAQNGDIRNAPDRPRDWSAPIAEAISPTMGGYGLGSGAAKVYSHAKEREWLPAAEEFGLLAAGMIAPGPKGARPRAVDSTGYYSQALEAAHGLKQAKGTPDQMLAQLKAAGVKQAEIEATKLGDLMSGKTSITRDEIVSHLEGHRVGLMEVVRDNSATAKYDAAAVDVFGRPYADLAEDQQSSVRSFVDRGLSMPFGGTKFSSYSLDPSNTSYRETVLHLPPTETTERWRSIGPRGEILGAAGTEAVAREGLPPGGRVERFDVPVSQFESGHFPEPNIVGHLMTSMVKHEGKPTYLIDQIQSDWGQALRDQQRIDAPEFQARLTEIERSLSEAIARHQISQRLPDLRQQYGVADNHSLFAALQRRAGEDLGIIANAFPSTRSRKAEAAGLAEQLNAMWNDPDVIRLQAEASNLRHQIDDAQQGERGARTPTHPLVNTTDQWTNTTLRKGLMQAADANADYVAIPSGKTVLSYNPGDQHGMEAFYNQIIPKNLGNLLRKLDPGQVNRLYADTLETPGRGQAGQGFSLFSLSPEMRERIKQGLPLFAVPAAAGIAQALQEPQP